jgi:hypothetical protein
LRGGGRPGGATPELFATMSDAQIAAIGKASERLETLQVRL